MPFWWEKDINECFLLSASMTSLLSIKLIRRHSIHSSLKWGERGWIAYETRDKAYLLNCVDYGEISADLTTTEIVSGSVAKTIKSVSLFRLVTERFPVIVLLCDGKYILLRYKWSAYWRMYIVEQLGMKQYPTHTRRYCKVWNSSLPSSLLKNLVEVFRRNS